MAAQRDLITLFLCGDVMTGRGIDQILPHPGDPRLFESYVHSAQGYVELAEKASGPIGRPVTHEYVWGDALNEVERQHPDARIVNLETAVTAHGSPWPRKGIHYRMHPANVPCLEAFGIDCCVLANNHVMDWGAEGLMETVSTLAAAGIRTVGAGRDAAQASHPAVVEMRRAHRVLVHAYGMESGGVPLEWRATAHRPGVSMLHDLSAGSVEVVVRNVEAHRRDGDLTVVSLHWGRNWGFEIEAEERRFAQRLIDDAGVDVVYGHSSHHVKGIEVYRGKLILYGCGDFLNDYEGIGGYEMFRGDTALMYFPVFDAGSGRLHELIMSPTSTRRFRIHRATPEQTDWLSATLNREGAKLGTAVQREPDGTLRLRWT